MKQEEEPKCISAVPLGGAGFCILHPHMISNDILDSKIIFVVTGAEQFFLIDKFFFTCLVSQVVSFRVKKTLSKVPKPNQVCTDLL